MRHTAEEAQKKGYHVGCFHCSSDPASLDGIIIPALSVGILDGTAPHIWEITNPGVGEQLIDLGQFWDLTQLDHNRDEIRSLAVKKAEAYKSACRFLAAAGKLKSDEASTIREALWLDKLHGAVLRLVRSFGDWQNGAIRPCFLTSFGIAGEARFESFRKNADLNIGLTDPSGSAAFFLDDLLAVLRENQVNAAVSYDPLTNRPNGIFLPGCRVAAEIIHDDFDYDKRINLTRFLDRSVLCSRRTRLRFDRRVAHELKNAALTSLGEAGEAHFELEAIYRDAMDFTAKEQYENQMIKNIL